MKRDDLVAALAKAIPSPLARSLVDEYLQIRHDVSTQVLGRASPGKFVESTVQALQALENGGSYDTPPNVDEYLRKLDSRASPLAEDLRICVARLARAMYTLRNKRNIAHKGQVEPNLGDLTVLHACAQWVLGEFLRHINGLSPDVAGQLIAALNQPVSPLFETHDGKRVVLVEGTVTEELLVLLASHFPMPLSRNTIHESLDRRSKPGINQALAKLWQSKLVQETRAGYVLTTLGLAEARACMQRFANTK